MDGNESKNLKEILAENGIEIYLILMCISFIANRLLNTFWTKNAPIFLLAVYVLYILVTTYNTKIKCVFEIDKKLLIGYLLIIPLIGTCIVGLLIITVAANNVAVGNYWDKALVWIRNSDNAALLAIFFSLLVAIGYYKGYEKEKTSNPAETKELMESMGQNCKFSQDAEQKLQMLEDVNGKINRIEDILENKRQMGYTATCIPIKYNAQNKTFSFVLIKNMSHSKAQWMFPGSHVEVSDNRLNFNVDLTDINIIPSEVIREKVKKEAGLEEIEFVDPNYNYVNPNDSLGNEEEEYQYPNTCWPVKAPVFNYLFKVSEYANCYNSHEHRCHYDFTYVGEYKRISKDLAEYEFIEMEFSINDLKLENDARRSDIAYIKNKLEDTINKRLRDKAGNNRKKGRLNIPLDELCLDSIPQMIYNTMLFYKDYKQIEK